MLWTSQAQLDKLAVLKPIIGGYINDALRIIQGLGFKINEDRDIPICLETGLKSNIYGTFSQDWRKDKNSTIELNQDKILAMGENRRDLKTTIIHELMHYFQSEYDRRTPYKKAGTGAEELIIYESGAVWIEQFMMDGKLNANFVQQYIYPFGRSLKDLEAIYADDSQVKGSYRVYQDHGYAMSTLLSYLTKQTWSDFSNQSIVELHEIWNKYWSPFTCLDVWFSKHSYGLLTGCEYDDFILELAQGNIPSDGSSPIDANMLAYNSSGTLKGDGKIDNMSGSCLIYGTDCKKVNLNIPKDIDISNKQIIIKQENEGVHTYTFIKSTKGKKLYKTPITPNSPLTISANELDQMRDEEGNVKAMLFTLSTNIENSSTLPSNVSVEITGEKDDGSARVHPDEVRIGAAGSTELVTIDKGSYKYCGVDPVPSAYDSWLSVMFNADRNEVAITALPNNTNEEREGTIYCWVSNKEYPSDAEKKLLPVTVIQDAGNAEETLLDVTDLVFPVEGGVKTIKYSFGEYQWMSRDWDDDTWLRTSWSKDYLSVISYNPSSDNRFANELYVSAFPNESGVERKQQIRFGYTNEKGQDFNKRKIYSVNVLQEGGSFSLDKMKNLFVGTWYTPQDIIYKNGDYYHRRRTFRADNTYVFEGQTTSSTSKPSSWVEEETGTYTIRDYSVSDHVKIHIEIPIPGGYLLGLIEVWPHFMYFAYENTDGSLVHGVYMERE